MYYGPYSASLYMPKGDDEKIRRQKNKDVIVHNGLYNATSDREVNTNVDD